MLRDRSNGTRGQAAPACTPLAFPHCATLSDRTTAGKRHGAWSMRTVLDLHQGRARSDLLFTMSDNPRTPGPTGWTRIFIHFWTSGARSWVRGLAKCAGTACTQERIAPSQAQIRSAEAVSSSRKVRIPGRQSGGARRDRTDDLLLAKQALSQLSYGPFKNQGFCNQASGKLRLPISDI